MKKEQSPEISRQAKYQEKLRNAVVELDHLKHDVSAAARIVTGVVDGLKTIAVESANERALTIAIGQLEAALGLLDADSEKTND